MYYTIFRDKDYKIIYDRKGKYFNRSVFINSDKEAQKLYLKRKELKKNGLEDKPIYGYNNEEIGNLQIFDFTNNPKLLMRILEINITKPGNYEYINFARFEIENSKSEYRYSDKPDKKLHNICSITVNEKVRKGTNCYREKEFHKYNLFLYICCFRHLIPHGNMVSRSWNYCHDKTIEILYLGLLLFKKITICWGFLLYFEDFDPIIKVDKIIDILDNNREFIILPKNDLYELSKHLYNIEYSNYKLLKIKDKEEYNNQIYILKLKYFSNIIYNQNIKDIQRIWQSRLIKDDKTLIKLHKTVKKDYFPTLEKIIVDNYLNKCLELNMAFGFTSLCIINAIKYLDNPKLTIIDQNQTDIWEQIGIKLLYRNKKYFKLIEDSYTMAITKFNLKPIKYSFNLIIIDGWSTFIDTLYIIIALDNSLEINGFLCIENAIFKSVEKIINYIKEKFTHFVLINYENTLVVFKKINHNKIKLEQHIFHFNN